MSNPILAEDGDALLAESGVVILSENDAEVSEFDIVDTFFLNNPYAESILYSPHSGDAVEILAIFDKQYLMQTPVGIGFQSSNPLCLCRTEDVESASDQDTVTIRGASYNVMEVQPDGTGITILVLSKDPIS